MKIIRKFCHQKIHLSEAFYITSRNKNNCLRSNNLKRFLGQFRSESAHLKLNPQRVINGFWRGPGKKIAFPWFPSWRLRCPPTLNKHPRTRPMSAHPCSVRCAILSLYFVTILTKMFTDRLKKSGEAFLLTVGAFFLTVRLLCLQSLKALTRCTFLL